MTIKSAADFTHDLAGSSSPAGVGAPRRQAEAGGDSVAFDGWLDERATEPSIDVQMLRDVLCAGLK